MVGWEPSLFAAGIGIADMVSPLLRY
jgi:hypothetical protein